VEGPLNPTTGPSQHPATARGNAIRKELFRHGIQPARCTLVYRQLSEDDLKHQGYAQLIFTADDPVPWSPSMPGTLSAFARINPEKELPSAMSGEWGLLLTRHLRFAYGSSSLPDDSETEAFFSNFSEYLNRHPEKSVCITGHTCDISSAGFNQRLGAARAASVRERLLELGVAPDRLQTGSAGEEQPIGENGSNQGQKANRRVELLIR
jgi:OOP family OmpA-OmpF porin